MSPALRALRGATTVEADDAETVRRRTTELLVELLERNHLDPAAVVSLVVTATPDLRSADPAEGASAAGLGEVAVLSARELDVDGGLARCVRVLLHVEGTEPAEPSRHVFLEGAQVLRRDLADG